MVYFLLHDPSVARIIDSAVQHYSTNPDSNLNTIIGEYIFDSLSALTQNIAPSHLADALWVYAYIKRKFLLTTDSTRSSSNHSSLAEEKESHNEDGQEGLDRLVSALSYSDDVLHCQEDPEAMEEIMHLRKGGIHTATTKAASHNDKDGQKAEEGSSEAQNHQTAIPALNLCLDALRSPARTPILLQPPSLYLLVRDMESLWCFTRLCKLLKLRALQQVDMLVGGGGAAKAAAAHKKKQTGPCLLEDICFHDYEVLVPQELMDSFLAHVGDLMLSVHDEKKGEEEEEEDGKKFPALSIEGLFAFSNTRRAERRHQARRTRRQHSPRADAAAAAPPPPASTRPSVLAMNFKGPKNRSDRSAEVAAPPSMGLIINPAVSQRDSNPQRQAKNKRLDVIDIAAMNFYYQQLAVKPSSHSASSSLDMMSSMNAQLRTARGNATVIDAAQMRSGGDAMDTVLPEHRWAKSLREEAAARESHADFIKNAYIGLDIQIMAMSGGAVGYYMGWLRGASTEVCLVYAIVGLVAMMLVDAVLLLTRMGRHDTAILKEKSKIARQRAKLQEEARRLSDEGQNHSHEKGKGMIAEHTGTVGPAEAKRLVSLLLSSQQANRMRSAAVAVVEEDKEDPKATTTSESAMLEKKQQ